MRAAGRRPDGIEQDARRILGAVQKQAVHRLALHQWLAVREQRHQLFESLGTAELTE